MEEAWELKERQRNIILKEFREKEKIECKIEGLIKRIAAEKN